MTALLLNLSYGGSQTRESILLLLLAGARQLGNVVSGHVKVGLLDTSLLDLLSNLPRPQELLTELAELKAAGGLASLPKEEEEEGKHRGVLADRCSHCLAQFYSSPRFTKESVVLVAPAKPKGGGELQLNSMTALTSKTSSQSFFLRVLKVGVIHVLLLLITFLCSR